MLLFHSIRSLYVAISTSRPTKRRCLSRSDQREPRQPAAEGSGAAAGAHRTRSPVLRRLKLKHVHLNNRTHVSSTPDQCTPHLDFVPQCCQRLHLARPLPCAVLTIPLADRTALPRRCVTHMLADEDPQLLFQPDPFVPAAHVPNGSGRAGAATASTAWKNTIDKKVEAAIVTQRNDPNLSKKVSVQSDSTADARNVVTVAATTEIPMV